MEWRGRRQSNNIEDRRLSGGGGGGVRRAGIGGGLGLLAIVVVGMFLGFDLTPLLNGNRASGSGGSIGSGGSTAPLSDSEKLASEFVSVNLADTEEIWTRLFAAQLGKTYTPAKLVLFRSVTASPCGTASGATGPFYCPEDKKVYLDTEFFNTMSRELGAKGDFAMAYVVAHEIGHHVQDELGILSKANRIRAQVSEAESNAISVRIELQADCLAGIWGREVQAQFGTIQSGDFEEAVNAARQIGDDTLQRNAGRVPRPDNFTHGTAAQRARWFQVGLKSGRMADCDTFSIANP
ncbi:MAG: neutral zinc metallopeptidase [Alphaproteobacteria bacterium]